MRDQVLAPRAKQKRGRLREAVAAAPAADSAHGERCGRAHAPPPEPEGGAKSRLKPQRTRCSRGRPCRPRRGRHRASQSFVRRRRSCNEGSTKASAPGYRLAPAPQGGVTGQGAGRDYRPSRHACLGAQLNTAAAARAGGGWRTRHAPDGLLDHAPALDSSPVSHGDLCRGCASTQHA